jgi:chemotaxis protein histidine kinase CheA
MADDLAGLAERLECGAPAPDAPEQAYSIAHSLHGAGTMYGFPTVSEVGASLERLSDALRSGRLKPTGDITHLIGDCAEALRNLAEPRQTDPARDEILSDLAWKCDCAVRDAADRAPHAEANSPPPA